MAYVWLSPVESHRARQDVEGRDKGIKDGFSGGRMNMTQAEHADRSLAGCLGPKFLYTSENQNPLPGILGADCIISSGRSRVRGLHLLLPKIVESPLTRRHLRAVQCLATHGRLSLTHAGVGKPSRVPARGIYGQHNSRQETLLVQSPCGKRSVGGGEVG